MGQSNSPRNNTPRFRRATRSELMPDLNNLPMWFLDPCNVESKDRDPDCARRFPFSSADVTANSHRLEGLDPAITALQLISMHPDAPLKLRSRAMTHEKPLPFAARQKFAAEGGAC